MGRRLHGDVPMTNRLGNPRSVWRRLLLDGGLSSRVHIVVRRVCTGYATSCVSSKAADAWDMDLSGAGEEAVMP